MKTKTLSSKDSSLRFDYIVVGSGIAGLMSALSASEKGKVLLITKKKIFSGSTPLAQGGIAVTLSQTDNFEKHIQDTLKAGAFHNNKKAVEHVIKNGPKAIKKLTELEIYFDRKGTELSLGLEGGHSENRIIHIKDTTGKAIEEGLIKNIKNHKNITIWENSFALDLIVEKKTAKGLFISRKKKIIPILSKAVILATGGVGQVFEHTTNPKESTGDGITLAARAGAKLKDMEFIQFHPTAFAKKEKNRHFLLSEALRGEGAILVNKNKKRFINELSPRDIVSQAIYEEQKKGPVYLAFENRTKKDIRKRFPSIFEYLKKHGYNLANDLIPITPVAHYLCGGIQVNNKSESSVKNLFAIGECACTGLHGANRLASNSLLEAAVFGSEISRHLPLTMNGLQKPIKLPKSLHVQTSKAEKRVVQKIMWEYAGIVRTSNRLKTAIQKLKKLQKSNTRKVALAICNAAMKRKKSLGCHKIID